MEELFQMNIARGIQISSVHISQNFTRRGPLYNHYKYPEGCVIS
jgi:hypothetical protein